MQEIKKWGRGTPNSPIDQGKIINEEKKAGKTQIITKTTLRKQITREKLK